MYILWSKTVEYKEEIVFIFGYDEHSNKKNEKKRKLN